MSLTPAEVHAARSYKYNGKDDSLLIRFFYRRIWDRMILWFPESVAPNLITLGGFLLVLSSFILTLYITDGARLPAPGWLCFINGVFLATYQTMDNLDGRQARRTGTSSALGQFFDHGCDAMTGMFEVFKVALTLGLGPEHTFYFVFLTAVGFYLTSWEEYATHAFYLGPLNGPDEGLTLFYLLHILFPFVPQIREVAQLPVVPFGFVITVVCTVLGIVVNVGKMALKDRAVAYRAITGLFPVIVAVVVTMSIVRKAPGNIKDPFFALACGLTVQFLSQITIFSFLTGRTWTKLFHPVVFLLWMGQLLVLFVPEAVESGTYWMASFIITITMMVGFDIMSIKGLAAALSVDVFSVRRKPIKIQ